MIESELIYLNPDIQNNLIIIDDYKKILESVDEHIKAEEDPESHSVELLKGVKEFLYTFPLECIKDISVGPAFSTISYDCIKGNKKIGTYGLVVNFEYWQANGYGGDGGIRFDTSFEVTLHNKKRQYTVGWRDSSNQKMELDGIKEACLLNTWSNLELQRRLHSDEDLDKDFLTTVGRELYKALNNKYIQAYYSLRGKNEYLIELTPKVILNNKYNPSTLELEYDDNKDVTVNLKAGVDASKSKVFLFKKNDDETQRQEQIKEAIKDIRASKSLIYSYSINSFSDKIFAHKLKEK